MTCPTADDVTAALHRIRGPGEGRGEWFRLFIAPRADQTHVELVNSAGRSVLARDLSLTSFDCQHVAEAVALIVERHFRAIEWSPVGGATAVGGPAPTSSGAPSARPTSPPPLSPAPSGAAQTRPATPPAVATTTAPPSTTLPGRPTPAPAAVSPPAATPPAAEVQPTALAVAAITTAAAPEPPSLLRFDPGALPRLAFGAGPAFWSRDATFAAALSGRWRVLAGSPVELGLGVLLPPSHSSTAVGSGGSVRVGAVPVTASVGLAAALGKLALGTRVGTLWTIERGQSQSIPVPATAWRTVFGVGLGISGAWPIARRLRLTGSLDGYRTVLGRSYAIAGVSEPVLDPAPWQVIAMIGAEWVISP